LVGDGADHNENGAVEEADAVWMQALAHEWRDELSDPREDIYTLEDGEALDAKRDAPGLEIRVF